MDQRIKLRIEYLRANLKYLNDVELAEYNRLTGQHLTHQQQHQQHTHQQVQETYQADQASNFDLQNSSDGFNKHHKSRPFKKPKNKKKSKKVGFWKKLRRFLLLVLDLMIGFFIKR